MLIYLRHGKTPLNAGGGGEGERLRGWLPVPLTVQGEKDAHTAASEISLRPDTFSSSDLPRAHQTAQIVGEHLGMVPTLDERLRDWNTGNLAGQPVKDVLPLMHHLFEHPDLPAPGGESVQDYLARFEPAIREKVAAPGVHLVVGHGRGSTIIQGIASPLGGVGGPEIDRQFLFERPELQPGGVMTVDPQWNVKIKNPGGKNGKSGPTGT